MAAGEQVSFQPALALVLADSISITRPSGASSSSSGRRLGVPRAVGDLEDVLPAVRVVLVRAEETEVPRLEIQLHHVAEEPCPSPASPRHRPRPEPARRPRSRGNRAAAGLSTAGRRWRADWRPSAARPSGASSASSARSRPLVVEELLGPVALHPLFENCERGRGSRASPPSAPGAIATTPLSSCRRLPSVRSSPSACGARSSAIAGRVRRSGFARRSLDAPDLVDDARRASLPSTGASARGSSPSTK